MKNKAGHKLVLKKQSYTEMISNGLPALSESNDQFLIGHVLWGLAERSTIESHINMSRFGWCPISNVLGND